MTFSRSTRPPAPLSGSGRTGDDDAASEAPSDRTTSQHVHLALLGLMGAGKSSVGRIVANELGRPFVDSDSLIELRCGRRPFELAEEQGLDELHRREAAEANRILTRPDAVVFAAAASVIDEIDEIDLSRTWSVWLEASPEVLAARTSDDARERPVLDDGDHEATLARQHDRRSARGRAVADAVVDTDGCSAADVAEQVCAAWHAHLERVAARRGTTEWPQGARGR